MAHEPSKEFVEFDLSIHIFTVSATLVGVCLTVIGIMRHLDRQAQHIGQELLALDAFLFLICCIFSYLSLKTRWRTHKRLWMGIADNLFLIALSMMVVICALIVYEFV